jgi:Arc/MetJ-type ribon-helix-helix transcriptional regulator
MKNARVLGDDEMMPDSREPMVSRSIRLPLDVYEWLQAQAAERGFPNWSMFARHLLETARRDTSEPTVPVKELRELIQKFAA